MRNVPGTSHSEDQELLELQRALTLLTVRVAELRTRRTTTPTQRQNHPSSEADNHRTFDIGDRVYFRLDGSRAEGVIIDRTNRRFRIRHSTTGFVYLRSATTITLIV
jgi:hypothetical protein